MTEQAKTVGLSPDEWKQLCVLNCAQLQNYLNGIAPQTEGGASGLNAEHLALIDQHVARGRAFLNAWAASKPVPAPPKAAVVEIGNGAAAPEKAKRKYTRRAAGVAQQ